MPTRSSVGAGALVVGAGVPVTACRLPLRSCEARPDKAAGPSLYAGTKQPELDQAVKPEGDLR